MPRWPRGNRNRDGNRGRGGRWNHEGQLDVPGKIRPPPGLRGKAIGLFYRDLHRNMPKKDRENTMRLSIPLAVTKLISNRLQSIKIIAEQQNIALPLVAEIKKIKKINTEPEDLPLDLNKIQSSLSHSQALSSATVESENSSSDADDEATSDSTFKKPLKLFDVLNKVKQEKKFLAQNSGAEPMKSVATYKTQPSTSSAPDFIPIKQENIEYDTSTRLLSLRGGGDFKYGYNDIITGCFEDKLEESLAKRVSINQTSTSEIKEQNESFYHEYVAMLERKQYKKMLQFRQQLPTYKKSNELLDIISNNSVVVISGETGCGKSTQVPQLILDDAIINKRGANTRIIVTQPRRIAASSLAERVADERAEKMGHSVGYAVRLERVESRARGSIMYFTTGILLNELEVNQGLTDISHVILDEVHERDTNVDLSMVVLKKILKKRKDLKVILMSATLDAVSLSAYFDNCSVLHIEGLAYPVMDIYLEEIIKLTGFKFDDNDKQQKFARDKKKMEKEIAYRADVGPWLESIKNTLDRNVYRTLLDYRIEEMCIELIVDVVEYICRGEPGAILIFLPGIADITKLLNFLQQANFTGPEFEIYPLHSKLPSLEQKKIFERPPDGVRKIIIATNIAETSITIDDIVYVVDCAKIKIKGLIVEENLATLQTEWVSQANLRQRRGRAGRCQAGICYHLITTHRAQKLAERLLPELRRSDLLEPVLMIKQLRLGKAEEALNLVPDPPAEATITWAVKHLRQLGALDENETLTPLGWHLARLPVHPAAGKLLLLGALFGCLDRAASVAAVWGFKDPFMLIIGKEEQANAKKRELAQGEPSDHIAISEAIIGWESAGNNARAFAYEYFLSYNTLKMLSDMKEQFGGNLKSMGFLPSGNIRSDWENRNCNNMSLFKAIVAASLYPNVGNIRWSRSRNINKPTRVFARTPEDGRVNIHPSSIMAPSYRKTKQPICSNPGANWLVYWLKQKSSLLYLLEVTLVYTLPLLFFGELKVNQDEEHPEDCFIGISSTKVRCKRETGDLLFELRALLDHVLANKVMASSHAGVRASHFENQVLDAVIELITAEDEQADYGSDSFDDSDRDSEYEQNQRSWRR